MRKQITGFLLSALTACVVNANHGYAAGGTFTRGCAARDMQIMMMIESSVVPAQDKIEAVRTIMHARVMCFEGQVVDALALYDDVARSMTSDWVLSGGQP
jgi:hypothetical protein